MKKPLAMQVAELTALVAKLESDAKLREYGLKNASEQANSANKDIESCHVILDMIPGAPGREAPKKEDEYRAKTYSVTERVIGYIANRT